MPTEQDWIALTRALDAKVDLPLSESGDRLYVEIDYSPSKTIERKLKSYLRTSSGRPDAEPPPKFLYCGARGSGKTTQLRRLARRLAGTHEVLLLDLAPVLPDRVTTLQLVTHIGLALLARLGQWEGADGGVARVLDRELGTDFRNLLATWVGDIDIAAAVEALTPLISATELVADGATAHATTVVRVLRELTGGRAALAPAERLMRAERLLRRLEDGDMDEARALTRQVAALSEALHGRAHKPVLLLVDGLDKVPEIEGVESAFDDRELLAGLPAALVLTAPATLSSSIKFPALRQDFTLVDLHNIPVVDADGGERSAGIETMTQIARRRLHGRLDALVSPAALRLAAVSSSGIPRDFLMLLSDAALLAEEHGADHIREEDVARVAKEFRLRLQRAVTIDDLRVLDRVLRTRRSDGSERGQELLYQNYIAWYPNDNGYWRPHELLARWVEQEAQRIAALDGLS